MTPRVSVLIPLYNGEAWIGETLRSLQAQTYREFEAVLVDDGSTDATLDEVGPFLQDPRFQLHRKPHAGIPATRNRALALAKGELIAFLDQDDLYAPDKLALQVARFDSDPSLGAVYSPVMIVNEAGRKKIQHPPWWLWRGAEGMIFEQALKHWTCIMVLSLMVRKTAVDAVGGFDEALYGLDDLDLVIRLAEKVPFGRLPKPLASWRWHTGSGGKKESIYPDQFKVLEKFRRLWPRYGALLDGHCGTAHFAYGHFLAKNGREPEAVAEYLKAQALRPEDPLVRMTLLGYRLKSALRHLVS